MCESDNKIIVLNRAGWINKNRILFYNYELQYKDNAPEKFCTREEMCKKYKLTRGSIHQLINDGKKGKDPSKRYKWKDFVFRLELGYNKLMLILFCSDKTPATTAQFF